MVGPVYARPPEGPRQSGRSAGRHRLAVRDLVAVDLEADALVQPERAARIVDVNPQCAFGHAALTEPGNARVDQCPSQAPPAPWLADEDVLDPASLEAEAFVLVVVDVSADLAGDLVSVPRDPPERSVRAEWFGQEELEVVLGRLAPAPEPSGSFDLGVEDRRLANVASRTFGARLHPLRQGHGLSRAVEKHPGPGLR